jgi:DNA polymerase-3 subunit alpha
MSDQSSIKFAHLHVHTQYSLLDGAIKISDLVKKASLLNHSAIAITDHGNMHGAIDFYQKALDAKIKPILGCELYVAPSSRHEKVAKVHGGGKNHHLSVLANSLTGYRNLCRLLTRAYREGFYIKPRVDHELLSEYREGLTVLSGCLAGELNHQITLGDFTKAKALVEFYAKTFKDNFYLEVQPHSHPEQRALNAACYELSKECGVPLVATSDCHYCEAGDHYAQEVLMCVSTSKLITDPTRIQHQGFTLYVKSATEMLLEFGDVPYKESALKQAYNIAEKCNVSLDFNTYYMPRFSSEESTMTPGEMMRDLSKKGLSDRLEDIDSTLHEAYWSRLNLELELIEKMGFPSYFLVVSDFIVWAKEQGIPVGPGRGSVAGSLVAYALRITDVDPLPNKLLFERFLNPDRISLPDIDVDFCINGRERVLQYVCEKYGSDNVAQIVTFGTLKAKQAIRDVGRVLGLSFAETDRIASLIPAPRQGFDYSLSESLKMEPRLEAIYQSDGKELIDLSLKLEGLTRHASTHAAGVVIGDRPLMELLPLMVDKEGRDVTQFPMGAVEKIGLVKFDFLGLKTLTVIDTSLKLIKESYGKSIDLSKLNLNDPQTYTALASGNTTGVFQLESSGISEMTMRLKPNSFEDLVAILALYRPGPLDAGMVDHYIERKHKREPVKYLHPLMENVLHDTYGIILYQEQIMQLARDLAGYSLAEADMLRRAMGKKKPEEMAKQRERFLRGAAENGLKDDLANEIFDQMETFARYGFNRSHSVAYAMISFQTAYLKTHYPIPFMAALMTLEKDDSDKTLKNITDCRRLGLQILPPSINYSHATFSVDKSGGVRFGLQAVKGIGEKAVSSILTNRESGGLFKSYSDFINRLSLKSVNRRVVESLVKSGALDEFGMSRREMFELIDDAFKQLQSKEKNYDPRQLTLFGMANPSGVNLLCKELPEWPQGERLQYERETLGFFISGHPLDKYGDTLRRLGLMNSQELKACRFERGGLGGVITALKLKNTKKGDRYASCGVEDSYGSIEAIVWPDTYKKYASMLEISEALAVRGKLEYKEDRVLLVIEEIELLAESTLSLARGCEVTFKGVDLESHITSFSDLINKYPGELPVKVNGDFLPAGYYLTLRHSSGEPVKVAASDELGTGLERLFGRPVIRFF